ncbi:ubiquinol-cytochrome c reductase iron-sulfur subunit [Agromyces binzhouensis]|uniref:Cytochrome bc1 complex Rieske iron-sulfur subunit n=1 Tax=Agromyces binzhouensis TaxID=1817495 RepID=A0A4Q2J8W4_9MICO|nr:Rieske (2Fe-2S) protein [Agromyces binzhouensis]RXZ43921.1 Rieske (2Fe-2S) protein [Agromyces binzhouensis]
MDDARELSRRTALALGGSGALGGALILAGCAPAEEPAGTGAPSGTGTDGGGEDPTPTAAAGEDVAALADIPVGGSISATIGGEPVLLSQPAAGEVVAFSAICTHQGCTVAPEGAAWICPCHGSTFDPATGDVEQGPALEPLPSVPVSVDGDRVIAG